MSSENNELKMSRISLKSPFSAQSEDHSSFHRPPLSVVIVKESERVADLKPSNDCHVSRSFPNDVASMVVGSPGFRLQPRRISHPLSNRGRKRGIQCLSPCSSIAANSAASNSGMSSSEKSWTCEQSPGESNNVAMAMGSLSIMSPRSQVSQIDNVNGIEPTRSLFLPLHGTPSRAGATSSFISYSSPSNNENLNGRSRVGSISSTNSSRIQNYSPSNSTVKSSPRLAPVKVLHNDSSQHYTPTQRPPLHGGNSFLHQHAKEGAARMDRAHTTLSSRCEHAFLMKPPIIQALRTPDRETTNPYFSTDSISNEKQLSLTPDNRSVRSAYHTPLPNIKLTPRSTPSSRGNSREETAYMTANDLGLIPTDIGCNDNAHCNPTQSSFLPVPEWYHSVIPPASRKPLHVSPLDIDDTILLPPPSIPNKSRRADFPGDLNWLSQREEALQKSDSLSDLEDDVPFVLMDPADLKDKRQSTGPTRQRQRLSYNSFDHSTAPSTTSLKSGFESNTSLLGVDFLRGDSAASLLKESSSQSFRVTQERKEKTCGLPVALEISNHGSSDESVESIGMALEPPLENPSPGDGRDLKTPPALDDALISSQSSPPPIKCGQHHYYHDGEMLRTFSGRKTDLSPQLKCPTS